MDSNKSRKEFQYKTYLNILHGPLELIDVQKLADALHRQMVQPDALQGERLGGQAGGDPGRISLARTQGH